MSNCDEDRSVYNGHYEIEVLIDRPVSQVWKQYLDVGSWVTSHRIEQASGAPDAVGAITRVTFNGSIPDDVPRPHHHYCKIVKLVPERHYLLKTYSEKGGTQGVQMAGFDDTRFDVVEGKTRLTFNLFIEIRGEVVAKDPTGMNFNMDRSRDGMLKNFENLKRIVEYR